MKKKKVYRILFDILQDICTCHNKKQEQKSLVNVMNVIQRFVHFIYLVLQRCNLPVKLIALLLHADHIVFYSRVDCIGLPAVGLIIAKRYISIDYNAGCQ